MADETIALEIFIEADKANLSLGELQEGVESINKELNNTGIATERFNELSAAVADASTEVDTLNEGFQGLDSSELSGEVATLAGGVTDVTAAFVLMGGESETMDELAGSIQTAMAVSMGFKGAIDSVSSGMKIYNDLAKSGKIATVAKAVAEKAAAAGTWLLNAANKALNTTMKLNPIGLIVTAIGLVIAAIVYFKDAIWGLIKTALKPFTDSIDMVIDGLQAMGIMATDEAIAQEAAAKKVVEAAKKRNEAAAEQRRVHKELTESMISDLDFEIRKRTIAGKDFAELSRKKIELLQEVAKEEAKAAENNRIALEATMEAMGFLGKAYDEVYKGAVDTAKAAADELKIISEDLIIHDLEQLQKSSESRALSRAKESQAKKDALMEDIERVEIDRTIQTEELDRHTIHIEGLRSNEEILHDAKNFWHNKDLERIEEERQARLAANQARLESATQVIGAIGSLNSAALANDLKNAGDNEVLKEKLRKASFEREKKLNIAMALINGAQAQMAILAQTPKADFGVATVIAMVAAAATTIGQIAAIKSTSYQGGGSVAASPSAEVSAGGAGNAGGGAQINPVTNTSTILGNQQVTVTETDITSTQNNVSVIEESATF